jgi:hypothetical protein
VIQPMVTLQSIIGASEVAPPADQPFGQPDEVGNMLSDTWSSKLSWLSCRQIMPRSARLLTTGWA